MIGISRRYWYQAAKNIPGCSHISTPELRSAKRSNCIQLLKQKIDPGYNQSSTDESTQSAILFARIQAPLPLPLIFKRNLLLQGTMATATHIEVSTNDTGILGLSQSAGSAKKASETLQADMERYNIFFNDKGFHNHLAHHILTTYALGASPDAIQSAFDRNATYQLPRRPADEAVVQKLGDKSQFHSFTGIRAQYPNFLAYFQRQIASKGIESVVNEYLFAGDKLADDMLVRLFAGIVHPFIQLGFGLEFNQPAIVAEALAETAVHELNLTFLLPAEKAAHEIIKIVSQFSVGPDQLDEKLAELLNAAISKGEDTADFGDFVSTEDEELDLEQVVEPGRSTASVLSHSCRRSTHKRYLVEHKISFDGLSTV
ncbi:hypothetical protein ACJ72_03745 [Emergomyces africanus]|uniref:Uncharacterized protein n=1 Tax=Emergomyces africanus TaxID=1955775 RepID=A0A1B7NYR4_9EURO|nr:hypothetical protein ACJ72_03745 [Emergomyces africanus]